MLNRIYNTWGGGRAGPLDPPMIYTNYTGLLGPDFFDFFGFMLIHILHVTK